MSDRNSDSAQYARFTDEKGLHHAVRTMPRWKKILLVMSLLIGVAGFGVQEASSIMRKSARPTAAAARTVPVTTVGGATPSGSSGFVGATPTAATPDPTDSTTGSPQDTQNTMDQSLSEKMTPYATRLGFSVFIGVVIGFLFRTFIKLALGISALIVALALALSYFHIINIDLTAVKAETATASAWIADQADRLKTMIFNALPSSTAAGLGFVFGFKRR